MDNKAPTWQKEIYRLLNEELNKFSEVFGHRPEIKKASFDVMSDLNGEDYCIIFNLTKTYGGRYLPKPGNYDKNGPSYQGKTPKVRQFTVNMIVIRFDFDNNGFPKNLNIGEGISEYMDAMVEAKPIVDKGMKIQDFARGIVGEINMETQNAQGDKNG